MKAPKQVAEPQEYVVEVTVAPETWIIAPLMPEEQVERYVRKGWLDEEGRHLDRCWPRNTDGKPVIFKLWLLQVLKRAARRLGIPREKLEFDIIDDDGVPVQYIVIPEKPLRYRRRVKDTTETFEYIDSTFTLKFRVLTKYPKEFIECLRLAGKIGIMARTKHGYGKFRVVDVKVSPKT